MAHFKSDVRIFLNRPPSAAYAVVDSPSVQNVSRCQCLANSAPTRQSVPGHMRPLPGWCTYRHARQTDSEGPPVEYLAFASTALPLAAFMVVASITPGPNNLLVATAGAHAGYRATLPHLLGIGMGHSLQVAICAMGIGAMLIGRPDWQGILKSLSAGYLVWLAIKLARAVPPANGTVPGDGGPMSFLGAAAFQWINPKAWMMALTASGALLPALPERSSAIALACATIVAVNFPCVSAWAAFGSGMRRFLTRPLRWRLFNGVMSASLLLTAWWIVRA